MATREHTLAAILDIGIVPIVRCESREMAHEAARAVVRGGVKALEVTMTVPGAIKVLESLADEFGDELTLGAGTVLDPETARICMLAGAEFMVTPGLNTKTIEICKRYSKVIIPGVLTPTEVMTAWEAGANIVKIFPVDNMGGPSYLKALKAPLPQVMMVPTGGVSLDNVADYFAAGASAVAVGSSMMNTNAMREGRFEVIEQLASDFKKAVVLARQP